MRCSAGLDLHACSYELASCLKGAIGSQICQSGAAMPDRLAPLLATNRLASATVNMLLTLQSMRAFQTASFPHSFLSSFQAPRPQTRIEMMKVA
jgi:hypothetical protein